MKKLLTRELGQDMIIWKQLPDPNFDFNCSVDEAICMLKRAKIDLSSLNCFNIRLEVKDYDNVAVLYERYETDKEEHKRMIAATKRLAKKYDKSRKI